jgi:hypothetical protein
MSNRILIGLLVFTGLGLSSGCLFHPGYRYPVRYAAHNNPGSFWTGVGLSAAGNTVIRSAHHASDPATALAVAAVGLGLHAAASGCYHHAATTPPRRHYVYKSRHRYSRRRDRDSYHYYGYR